MKLDKTSALFFGTKIDSKLREALSQSKAGDKKYFDGSSEEFLRIIDTGEEKWIGKVVKAGPVVTEVEDIQRNIVSIMRRVAPRARGCPASCSTWPRGPRSSSACAAGASPASPA